MHEGEVRNLMLMRYVLQFSLLQEKLNFSGSDTFREVMLWFDSHLQTYVFEREKPGNTGIYLQVVFTNIPSNLFWLLGN